MQAGRDDGQRVVQHEEYSKCVDDQRLRLTFLKTRSRLTMRTAWSDSHQRMFS